MSDHLQTERLKEFVTKFFSQWRWLVRTCTSFSCMTVYVNVFARACGAIGCISDCGSECIGFDPTWLDLGTLEALWGPVRCNLGQRKVRLFSLSFSRLLWWFRVVRSLLPHFPEWVSTSAESPFVGADVRLNCHKSCVKPSPVGQWWSVGPQYERFGVRPSSNHKDFFSSYEAPKLVTWGLVTPRQRFLWSAQASYLGVGDSKTKIFMKRPS
jgi:hypothetical protein